MEKVKDHAEQTLTECERMASSRDRHSSWSSYDLAAPRLRTPWDSRSSTSSASSSSSSSAPYVLEMSFLHTYPALPNHEEPSRRREYPRLSLFQILDELPATKSEEALVPPHSEGLRGGSSGGYIYVRPTPYDSGSALTREFYCDEYNRLSSYGQFGSDHSRDSLPVSTSNSQHHSFLYPQQSGPPLAQFQEAQQQQQQQQTEGRTPGKSQAKRRAMAPEERRKARTCIVDGCANYIVHRHRCFRHGVKTQCFLLDGGKRCSVDGCNTSAKQRGLCWRHGTNLLPNMFFTQYYIESKSDWNVHVNCAGGSVLCKVDGCKRGVKAKGLCWTHRDTHVDNNQELQDTSTAPSHCVFDGCSRAPILSSFCDAHSREVVRPGYIFEL